MSNPAISVRGLGKRYQLGSGRSHDTLRDHLATGAKALYQRLTRGAATNGAAVDPETFWALKDVSFDLPEGEILGVIGRNGAGKSTLLKILSQITEPTEGEIRVRGRVASLLEVGTGFHPELSGRENVYLNGAVLGMNRREIKAKFDEIVAFADVEKFLDTPVKRYSSGMYVRLAFAVAAQLEPDILIVDEVLAVGDAAFQKKCLGKMSGIASTGRTVIFVSHNLGAVQRFCTTGLYLEKGRLQSSGPIETVLDDYQRAVEEGGPAADEAELDAKPFRFLDWEIKGGSSPDKHACFTRDECTMAFRVRLRRGVTDVDFGFALWNDTGELIVAGQSQDHEERLYSIEAGTHELTISVRLPIKAGLYRIQLSLNSAIDGQLEHSYLEPKLHILPRLNTNLPERWHGIITEQVAFQLDTTSSPVSALP